ERARGAGERLAGGILRGGPPGSDGIDMLVEYAATPDVFDRTCYDSPEVCKLHLRNLKKVFLEEALVRDLRDGEWSRYLRSDDRPWHFEARKLLKALASGKRLRRFPGLLPVPPETDLVWCEEALASDGRERLQGIIVGDRLSAEVPGTPRVVGVSRLEKAGWFREHRASIRLERKAESYRTHLRLVLSCANSLFFIDPHLHPKKPSYAHVINLLQCTRRPSGRPEIQIHRVSWLETTDRRPLAKEDWESTFRSEWGARLQKMGLEVDVFLWDDLHDRYLISDLLGINLANGFDVSKGRSKTTTWHRLDSTTRDQIQREVDPSAGEHALYHRFRLPG
ncbi:MAG: hypothetical protein ABIH26_04065, partial [Candidatus Eisenbacteria bacterium]